MPCFGNLEDVARMNLPQVLQNIWIMINLSPLKMDDRKRGTWNCDYSQLEKKGSGHIFFSFKEGEVWRRGDGDKKNLIPPKNKSTRPKLKASPKCALLQKRCGEPFITKESPNYPALGNFIIKKGHVFH